jgi:hypothetical protein
MGVLEVIYMRRDIETRFKAQPNSLAGQITATRLTKDIDAAVRALPNRSEWLRRVITEAAQRELLSHCDGRVPRLAASGVDPNHEVES